MERNKQYYKWVFVPFLLLFQIQPTTSQLPPCHFPESSTQSFFFDVRADVPVGSVIVDSVVEPADARLKILDVRANNLKGDFLSRFEIVQRQSGQFILLTASDLHLPPFPSTISETTLYLTIECNQKAYPLISVRLRNYNSEAPQFLNEPYEMALVQETQVGSLLQTPVIAMDEDPADRYTITYELLNSQQNREFQLEMNSKPMEDLSALPDSFNKRPYSRQQLPRQLQLRVLSPLRRKTYYLNVSASDNQDPPKQSTTTLKVLVGQQNEIMPHFTQQEYYANFSRSFEPGTELILNQPLMAVFPEPIGRRAQNGRQSPVHYQLMDGRFSQLFELQEQTGRLFLKQRPFGDPTEQLELEIKAFLDQEPEKFVKAKLLLNDISEVHLTYFAQCHYEVHLAENAAPNTKVAQFIVRGDIAGIDLLNGTEYFNVDTDGTVTVSKDANIDYEEVDRIIITARLRSSSALHPKSLELCQIATIDIHIDDINDYSPKFEQQSYTFYTDEYPYNNTEIGVVRAKDEDKGTFGKVHYRLLDPDAPFTLFEADGEATIYYVTKTEDYFPDRSYTVTIEAFDAKEYPRTARVNVRILLQPAPATTIESSTQTYSATPATVIKKSEKVVKPIRTHGAVNEERDRVEVAESKEDEKTVEEQQEFAAGPETFGDEEEIRTEEEVKEKQKMEGIVGHEEATTEFISTSRSSTQPPTTKKASISREPPRFEQQNYNFSIDGHLEYGQYIGAIRLMQIEEDEDADEFKAGLEYTIEEGIKGFVKIDPEDGVLHVDNKLIEDSYEQIRFAAQARRGGQIIASTVVSVYMNESAPIYSQDPRFEQALYRFELEENQPAQQFAQVHAHHRAVELEKDHLWYTLNRDKDAAAFRIDPETGQLRSLEPLDAETKKFYSLKINACLESSTKRCAHSEAIVVIKDLNDNEPQFDQQQYDLKLPPDLSTGTEILQVHATDKDSGLNGDVRYELLQSNSADYFQIDEQTGQIRLIKAFGDAPTQLRFRVAAQDRAEPPMQGMAEVLIELTRDAKYTNENAPEFDDFRYEFSRPLPISSNMLIATVHATDPDSGENGRVWYKFAEDTPTTRKFTIDQHTGEIRTTAPLDMSMGGQLLQLLIEAHDSSTTFSRKSDTVVLLHLLGEKEERLEFLPLPKTVYISSAKPLGSTIFKVGLKNADLKDIHYTVEQDPRAELFAMIDDLLVVQSKLRPGSYKITIKAQAIPINSDPQQQKTMSVESHSLRMVVMTDRDKYPVFDKLSYELKIASNANFPVKLPAFNASVNEGRVGYSLYNSQQLKGVKIDSITGELTIFEEFIDQVSDDLPRGMVFIVVRATNIDHPDFYSDVGVRLGLLSSGHELVFTSRLYRLITKENASPGTIVNTVKIGIVEPELFSTVRLSLQPNDLFDINQNGSVIVKKTLDLETLPPEWKGIVELTVTARHIGQTAHAQIQIKIEDVNEHAPQFDQPVYEFKVNVDELEGTWIGQVHARDEDYNDKNSLTYRAIFGNAIGIVNVTRDGKLIFNKGVQMEPGKNYSLIIQASDSGRKIAEAAVHFFPYSTQTQQTPKPIEMPTMEKWTPENENDKMMLPPVNKNGNWQFEIMGGNEMDRIKVEKVNKTTAQLGLKTEHLNSPGNLQKAEDLIVLEISNLDDPFERLHTNISVDLNKVLAKKLEFGDEKTEIKVDLENFFDASSPIYKVNIRGANFKDLRFELTDNPLDIFRIDKDTGEIFIEWPLEQIIPGTHQITVRVHLRKQTIQRTYTVQFVGSSLATTNESSLSTQSVPQSTEEPTIPTSLEDSVDEHGTTIGTSVTIGSSGEEPEGFGFDKQSYTFEVKSPKKGATIGELKLKGAQGPVQWQLEPNAYRQWFDINQTTGNLYMKDVPFELKGRQRAEFQVEVVDLENLQNRAQVNVSIDLLLPDSESLEGGSEEETTSVEVETTTSNGDHLHEGNVKGGELSTPSQAFSSVSPTNPTQQLSSTSKATQQPLTEETPIFGSTPDFNLPQTTKSDLLTNLPTVGPIPTGEENSFHFKHQIYTAMLPERDYGNRGTVVNLKPAPLKDGFDDVVFGIDTADPNLPFFVRNRTGELIAFDNIDREQVAEFQFNVTAHSASDPSQQARALIKVTILDVNDNYPRFQNPTHLIAINADTPVGQVLTTFKATDADDGSNGRVLYRIKENVGQIFDLNSKGELTLTTKVSAFPSDLMNLTIEAIDGGRPALRTPHQIQVQVFHENQPQPFFHSHEYTTELPRGSDIGAYVTQVTAGVGPLNYLLLDDAAELFTIDNRGLVQLVRKPNTDDQNRYHTLTVIAESPDGKTANATLNVFVEGEPIVVTARPQASTQAPQKDQKCQFTAKTYNAEIKENTPGRTKLTTVKATCPLDKVRFHIHQATKEFQIDEQTGDVYAVEPLDREKKGLHLIVVNLTLADEPKRQRRQPQTINPIAEFVKNKLAANQALVLVKVLDQNDNPPAFTRLTPQNQYVFTVDWQAPLLQPIARVQAVDPDEHPHLHYSLSSNDYFIINETSGVIMVQRSLLNVDEEMFDLEVTANDGENEVKAPVKIYKLAPGLNIAILTVPLPEQEVDETTAARKLSQLLDKEARVLVKQVYIGEDGHADPKQTHLFVYAIDRETKKPVDGYTLKSMLDKLQPTLQTDQEIPISSISLPATASTFHLTVTEMILLGVSVCLLFMACCMLFVLLRCCKRKTILAKPDMQYMVESRESNPRPYNVELISRKQAQQVLAARPLPDSHEEITMSPETRAAMISSAGIHLPSSHHHQSSSQRTISSTVTDEMPHAIDCPSADIPGHTNSRE